MRRGDLVTVALNGDFGKQRPALIIQSDQFAHTSTATILLLTGTLVDAPLIRINLNPTPQNGLLKRSQIMVDKAMTVRRDKLGEPFGHLDDTTMISVNRAMALFFGFG